jgi:FkbM family methyltransferase
MCLSLSEEWPLSRILLNRQGFSSRLKIVLGKYLDTMTTMSHELTGSLGEIIAFLQNNLARFPRRTPGEMLLEQRPFRYVDLHSFYHQTMQIFGQSLYDFQSDSPAPVILDCGAHIGLASLFFKQRYPNARIIAFEADPAICEVLRFNLNSFGILDVEVHQSAVWVHDRGVTFERSTDDAGKVRGESLKSESPNASLVPSMRLKTLLSQSSVDLVKLDIEGAEFEVIADCGEALRNAKLFLVEAHMFGYPQQLGALLSNFEKHGFRYMVSDLHHATWLPVDGQHPPFRHCTADKFIITVFAWRV